MFYTLQGITALLALTTVRTTTTSRSACLIMTCVMGQMTAITDVTRRTAVTFASCVCTSIYNYTCEVKRGNFVVKFLMARNTNVHDDFAAKLSPALQRNV